MNAKVWDSLCWAFLSVTTKRFWWFLLSFGLNLQSVSLSEAICPESHLMVYSIPRSWMGPPNPKSKYLCLFIHCLCDSGAKPSACKGQNSICVLNSWILLNQIYGDCKGRKKVTSFVLVVKVRIVGWRALAASLEQLSICELVLWGLEKVIYPQTTPGQGGASPDSWGPLCLILHVRLISVAN